MLGKDKCRILKQIRQKIADENDIPYVTRECSHRGNCSGTCPRCESELRYLEQQLAARQRLGKGVAVAALCAGLAMTAAACTPAGGGDTVTEAAPQSGDTQIIDVGPATDLGSAVAPGDSVEPPTDPILRPEGSSDQWFRDVITEPGGTEVFVEGELVAPPEELLGEPAPQDEEVYALEGDVAWDGDSASE